MISRHFSASPSCSDASIAAPAVSAARTAAAASGPATTGRAGTPSRARSASCRVWSSDTTGVMDSPGAPACTAYSPAGTPSAGTSSTSAGSASATPVIVPVSRTWPSGSPACGGVTRTPPGSSSAGRLANGLRLANGTASAAVSVPAASPASSSASGAASSAVVATTALPR